MAPVYYTWALIDRHNGAIRGSSVATTNYSNSTVKIWLAADYLRRLGAAQPADDIRHQLSIMIRDSDNAAADMFWKLNGKDAGMTRMISMCHLTDTTMFPGWWSMTRISARDLARLGLCVADGTASGPTWRDWIIDEMRSVRGSGLFGIKPVLPAADASQVAIKNGWYSHNDGRWRVNCLGVHPDWSLAILTSYPASLGFNYGVKACENVTRQVLGLVAP